MTRYLCLENKIHTLDQYEAKIRLKYADFMLKRKESFDLRHISSYCIVYLILSLYDLNCYLGKGC